VSSIIPPQLPKLPAEVVNRILAANHVVHAVALLSVRAYRRDTMGKPGVNDAGIYDDAIFLRFPGGMLPFNANTDPSRFGWNADLGKPFAQLKCGTWPFIRGLHKGQYMALRQPYEEQADELDLPDHGHFTVIRDDGRGHRYEDNGYHAINLHRGGANGTSSWGCQTIPPDDYPRFIAAVTREMKAVGQKWIPNCLIDGPVI